MAPLASGVLFSGALPFLLLFPALLLLLVGRRLPVLSLGVVVILRNPSVVRGGK